MTPQQLMDLPYAGMAEKKLRQTRQWVLTKDEEIAKVFDAMKDAHYELEGAMYDMEKLAQ